MATRRYPCSPAHSQTWAPPARELGHDRILADSEWVLGGDHPDTLAFRHNLALAYREAGDLGRATPLLKAVLAQG